eukprot:scaffold2845_cov444-Prasinococcus_capsulatus_cf.AAC.1
MRGRKRSDTCLVLRAGLLRIIAIVRASLSESWSMTALRPLRMGSTQSYLKDGQSLTARRTRSAGFSATSFCPPPPIVVGPTSLARAYAACGGRRSCGTRRGSAWPVLYVPGAMSRRGRGHPLRRARPHHRRRVLRRAALRRRQAGG